MLEIKNLAKLLNHCISAGSNVIVTEISSPLATNPQRTYDITFQHKDRPGRDFLFSIDRETPEVFLGMTEYRIFFCELGAASKQLTSDECKIWHANLKKPKLLLDFIDTLIQTYTQ